MGPVTVAVSPITAPRRVAPPIDNNTPTTSARRTRAASLSEVPAALLGACVFLLARAAEDAVHAVVAFVAGVLVHRLRAPGHRDLGRPRFGPRGRIIDCEFVEEGIGIDPRK